MKMSTNNDNQPPPAWRIESAMSVWQSARARMAADDPEMDQDLLDDAQHDVQYILARVLQAAVDAGDMADAAKARVDVIQARRTRYTARKEALRSVAMAIMQAMCQTRVTLPDMTATVSMSKPSVVITNIELLAPDYVRIVKTARKADIAADIALGVLIDGAEMSAPTQIMTIRTQ